MGNGLAAAERRRFDRSVGTAASEGNIGGLQQGHATARRGLRHVALNALFLRPPMGGMERYVRAVIPELVALRPDTRFTVVTNPLGASALAEDVPDSVRVVTPRALDVPHARTLSQVALLPLLLHRQGVDLVHSMGIVAPLYSPVPNVLTMPDIIWLTVRDPYDGRARWVWRTLIPMIARRADRLITFSDASKSDVSKRLRIEPSMIDPVPLAGLAPLESWTSEAELRRRFRLGSGPIVLCVASVRRKHKNLERLIEALPILARRIPAVKLVVAGKRELKDPVLEARAASLGVAGRLRLVGQVDPEDLEGLYRAAACCVVASVMEGFGLPVLEAMQRGAPVACSRASSLPEVAGDAAEYFDPYDRTDIAAAIANVLTNDALARRLSAAGRVRQSKFTWRATAEGTLRTYDRAWQAAAT